MLLSWFYLCFMLEKTDPLQGGYLRRKYRKDRRPTFPRENVFKFYSSYLVGLIYKHFKMAGMIYQLAAFRRKLKRDPRSLEYTDEAISMPGDTDKHGWTQMNTDKNLVSVHTKS
jgi:hypothetical protein